MSPTYTFASVIWLFPGQAAWHCTTVPVETTREIDDRYALNKAGWGSLPVNVTIGDTTWQTSIFPQKKLHTYLLPLKAEIRKREKLKDGDMVTITLKVRGG